MIHPPHSERSWPRRGVDMVLVSVSVSTRLCMHLMLAYVHRHGFHARARARERVCVCVCVSVRLQRDKRLYLATIHPRSGRFAMQMSVDAKIVAWRTVGC